MLNRGAEHEHLEEVIAFIERRCSRKIIRHWKVRRVRIRKAEAEEQRRLRAIAKEKARQESALHVDVDDDVGVDVDVDVDVDEEEDEDDANSDAAPVSPVRAQPDDGSEMSDEEEVGASPSDARVGANLR